MAAASLIGSMIFLASFVLFMNLNKRMKGAGIVPKLLIDNSKIKNAPFYDASGAHAGALLGDVLHDPLQSFFTTLKLIQIIRCSNKDMIFNQLKQIEFNELLDPLFKKNKEKIIQKSKYEALFTNKNELFILGSKGGEVKETEALSANRYLYAGDLTKITTTNGKELTVTPEHKIATRNIFGKIIYKEAFKLTKFDNIVTLDTS